MRVTHLSFRSGASRSPPSRVAPTSRRRGAAVGPLPLTLWLLAAAHPVMADDRPHDPWAFTRTPADPTEDATAVEPEEDKAAADPAAGDATLPDPATVDWSGLTVDPTLPATWMRNAVAPPRKDNAPSAWSRTDRADGFSTVTVKQPVLPLWDTRVGADFNIAGQAPAAIPLPEKLAADGRQSAGTAWAATTAPGLGPIWDKTAVEARLDPAQDQTRLGTTISKSVPLAGDTALQLQSGYNVTDQANLPLLGGPRTARGYGIDESAKLNFAGSGTSLLASQSLSTNVDRWLRTVGAEQSLLGGVRISGTVSETASGNLDKSLTAGFTKTW
jgi:hypothetical protein